jgi:hypothetical protein
MADLLLPTDTWGERDAVGIAQVSAGVVDYVDFQCPHRDYDIMRGMDSDEYRLF